MSNFTPGPWVAASHPSSIVGWPVMAKSGGRAIASVHVRMGTDEAVAGANARLIAAAPDIYVACNGLLGLLQLIEGRCDPELLDIIRTNHRVIDAKAALAKARC